jgi:hypothetical protein
VRVRTTLFPLVLLAAAAALSSGCKDMSREMADQTNAHAPEDRPMAQVLDGAAGSGAAPGAPAEPGAAGAPNVAPGGPGPVGAPGAAPGGPGAAPGGAAPAAPGAGPANGTAPTGEGGTEEAEPPAPRGSVVVIPPGELGPAAPGTPAPGSPGTPAPGAAGSAGAPAPGTSGAGGPATAGSPGAPAAPAPGGTAPGAAPGAPAAPGAQAAPGAPAAAPGAPGLPSTPKLPPPAEALPVTAVAVGPDGARVPVTREGDTAIPPGASLELSSPLALVDVRFRVFDEDDRLVPVREQISVGKGTRVAIAPEEPLPPGSAFRLEIAGQLDPHPTTVDGTHFGDRVLRFHTTGEKPPPPPPPERKHRRRH